MSPRGLIRHRRRKIIYHDLHYCESFKQMIDRISRFSPEIRLTLKLDLEEMLVTDSIKSCELVSFYNFLNVNSLKILYNLMCKHGF